MCLAVVPSMGAVWSSTPATTTTRIVGIKWRSTAELATLEPLRYVAPGVAIIRATDGTSRQLVEAGFEVLFTDQATSDQGWYLIDHLHDTRPPDVDLIYEDPSGWALVRLQTERLPTLLEEEHFLYPLPAHYVTPTLAPALRTTAREPAAAVITLLEQVDTDRLRATVERLSFIDPALGAVRGNVRSRYARRRETFESTTYLRQRLAAELGENAVHLDSFRVTPQDSLMYNVVGELAGTDPDAGTYIICAHYDAIGSRSSQADLARVGEEPGRWDWMTHPAPGADDNGSGVAVVVESARLLASAGPFPWSIRFVTWSGEELGLWGSRHYAKAARARGDHILGVLNFDMVGFNDLRDRLELVS
ncbi:MAG: M28 family peptidase, partial [bacterium]|nr:M28 family peptidase [bacterium]